VRRLVDYSSSDDDDDSFLATIDRISLSPSPPPKASRPSANAPKTPFLTPIPLKFRGAARRIIDSASEESPVAETPAARPPKFKSKGRKREISSEEESSVRPPKVQKKKAKITSKPAKPRPKARAQKRDMSSDSSDSSTPVRRAKPKPKAKSKAAPKPKENLPPTPLPPTPNTPKKKRWTVEDSKRLKVAMKTAVNPQSEADWEVIARSVGVGQTTDECRKQAALLGWKPEANGGEKGKGNTPKTRKSTADADFFRGKAHCEISMLELDPDDSLLSALRSPEEQAKNARRPFIPQVLNETNRRSLANSSTLNSSQLNSSLD